MTDNPLEGTGDKYSIRTFDGDGSQTVWEFNFDGGFISRSHVKIFVTASDGTITLPVFTWIGDSTINVTPAVATGSTLTIYRDTPKDTPMVNYTDGAILSELNLDRSAEQSVFAAAEMVDRFGLSLDIANEAAGQVSELRADLDALAGEGGLANFVRVSSLDKDLKLTYSATGSGDDTAKIVAANAGGGIVHVPAGRYSTTGGFYDYANASFMGPGKLVIAGKAQANNRSFLTTEVEQVDDSRLNIFDKMSDKCLFQSYMFVGSAVGSTNINTYTNLTAAAMSIQIYDFTGGKNTDASDHALGRTGAFMNVKRMYHGGQGDLTADTYFLTVYSTRDADHFLAEPAIAMYNGNIGADGAADGCYLQGSEVIFSDAGRPVAAIDSVRNYIRTNASVAKHQVWGHDRVQSGGSQPIDWAYSVSGPVKVVLDVTDASSPDKSIIRMKAGDRIYMASTPVTGPLGERLTSTPGNTWFEYNSTTATIDLYVNGVKALSTAEPTLVTPTLLNSWVAETVDYGGPKYRKLPDGRVALQGVAKAGANFTVLFTLPVGYRPTTRKVFTTSTVYGTTQVQVWTSGDVVASSVADNAGTKLVGLDGVTFDIL